MEQERKVPEGEPHGEAKDLSGELSKPTKKIVGRTQWDILYEFLNVRHIWTIVSAVVFLAIAGIPIFYIYSFLFPEFFRPVQFLQAAVVIPPGTIVAYAGETVPDGWLPCDGRLIDLKHQPQMEKLRDAIKKLWGNAEGKDEKVFNIPDFHGIFLRGVNVTRAVGSFEEATGVDLEETKELPIGTHATYVLRRKPLTKETPVSLQALMAIPEIRPKNAAVNWIIKY